MKRLSLILIIGTLVFLLLFSFRGQVESAARNLIYYSPCNTPIAYNIGTIDPEFKVTRKELLEDAKTAANIWSSTQGKQLFVYDPDSTFTINMVYDDRQKLTSKISELNTDLKNQQSEIDPKLADFEKQQALFEQKVNALNQRISYWNGQGGAPKEEYDKLVAEQQALQKESDQLNNMAEELGQSTQEYNSNARILNKTIDDYKEVLVENPEEGLYEQEGRVRKISIYIDVDNDEFLHTLAHEFGHALGLEHIDDKQAIMYPQTNNILIPSSMEVAQLSEICKTRTIVEEGVSKFREAVQTIGSRFGEKN